MVAYSTISIIVMFALVVIIPLVLFFVIKRIIDYNAQVTAEKLSEKLKEKEEPKE